MNVFYTRIKRKNGKNKYKGVSKLRQENENIEFKWENDGWMDESRVYLKISFLVLYYNFFISLPFSS